MDFFFFSPSSFARAWNVYWTVCYSLSIKSLMASYPRALPIGLSILFCCIWKRSNSQLICLCHWMQQKLWQWITVYHHITWSSNKVLYKTMCIFRINFALTATIRLCLRHGCLECFMKMLKFNAKRVRSLLLASRQTVRVTAVTTIN